MTLKMKLKMQLKSLYSNPLIRFLGRRVVFLILTLIVFLLLIFTLPRAIPGSPINGILAQLSMGHVDPATMDIIKRSLLREFDLNSTIDVQFSNFISRLLRGDLGRSISNYPTPVADIVFMYLPYSLGLLIPAALVSWIIGNLLGALAAYRRKTAVDNALLPVFLALSQTPYYWLGMILVFIFGVTLRNVHSPIYFPTYGGHSSLMMPELTLPFILDFLWHYTLPFLSIVIVAIGGWAIGMRSMVLYELGADYVGYSDSLGLPDRKVLGYVFKNSMLPQVTGLALNLGTVMGGALITELVFSYPGMGYHLTRAVTSQDYPVIQGIFIFLISTLLIANLIVDLVYAYIDPRIRTGYVGE
jgi:peptide/nickel transport system permease protein